MEIAVEKLGLNCAVVGPSDRPSFGWKK